MRKIIISILSLVALTVLLALAPGPVAAYDWENSSIGAPAAANDTLDDDASTYGPYLYNKYSASSDQTLRFLVPLDSGVCPGGAIKNIKLALARGSALTITGHPQAENATWEYESQVYELNYRVFSPDAAASALLEHPLSAAENATGGSEDLSAGEVYWIEFHGQINGLQPGGAVYFDVSRNATNSADNSTSSDFPLGLWWDVQRCSN